MTTQTSKRIESQCKAAFLASKQLVSLETKTKNNLISAMAKALETNCERILEANTRDMQLGKEHGLSTALLDRLLLNKERIQSCRDSLEIIQQLDDPIGEVLTSWVRPNGLKISKLRVPLGVIGIIYEARPNVTVDAIGLTLKTGNSVVLRGSSSAYQTNREIVSILQSVLSESGLNESCIQLLEDTSREGVKTFVKMKSYLSLIIPRGGAGLIQSVVKESCVPTIETGVGNCHLYVDQYADLNKALAIVINAKTQRPSVCNACESVLVHRAVSETFLTKLCPALIQLGVEIRGCTTSKSLYSSIQLASEEDWDTEFLDLILAIKVVDSIDDALDHIDRHGTFHTEGIISEDNDAITRFSEKVDASAVVINTSTRFTDGGEFGFGAEIGISTQKLHARGPMGLPELTSYKYLIEGSGQIRS